MLTEAASLLFGVCISSGKGVVWALSVVFSPSVMIISINVQDFLSLDAQKSGNRGSASDYCILEKRVLTQKVHILSSLLWGQHMQTRQSPEKGGRTSSKDYGIVFGCNFIHDVAAPGIREAVGCLQVGWLMRSWT